MDQASRPNGTTAKLDGFASDSRSVAAGILASRVTGFGRVAIMAAVLGPTYFGNLFQFSSLLPSTLYSLLMGALMSPLLVPPLVRRIEGSNRQAVRRFANGTLGLMMVVLVGAGAVTVLVAPLLLGTITFSVRDAAIRDQHLRLGVQLALMLMPQVVLYGIIGTAAAVQQAHGRFALAAAAPVVENLGIIVVLSTSAILFGTGIDLHAVTTQQVLLLGLGTTAAVAVHACVQWWGAYRLGVPLVPRPQDWGDAEVRTMLRQGSSSIGYTGLYWSAILLALVSAGAIPGGIVAFQMAGNVCQFPVALTAAPLAWAQLPRLSANHHYSQLSEFRSTYLAGLRLVIFMALPASLILAAIPQTVAGAIAYGQMHSPTGIALLASCIGGLAIGVVGEAIFTLVTSSCYARNDRSTPLRAMAMRLLIAAAGIAIARSALSGPHLLWTLGAILAAANIVAGVYLHSHLRRALRANGPMRAIGLGELIFATVSVVPAMLVANSLGSNSATIYQSVFAAVIAVTGSAMTYIALHFFRGSLELTLLLPIVKQMPFFALTVPRAPPGCDRRFDSGPDASPLHRVRKP